MRRSSMPPPAIRTRQKPLRVLSPVDTSSSIRLTRRPSRRSWEFTIIRNRVEEPDASIDEVIQALMKELEKT